MKAKLDLTAQAILGLIFFVFGLNGFLHFIPQPEPPEPAMKFMGAMMDTGYFLPVLKLVETVAGLLLLVRRFSALALVLLAPIVVQILLFHMFLAPDPAGLGMAVLIFVLEAYLGFTVYIGAFRKVLSPNPLG